VVSLSHRFTTQACNVEAGAALRPAEPKDLRGRRRQIEDLVVALEAERHVEARQRDRHPVAEGRDDRQVELVQRCLDARRLGAEALAGDVGRATQAVGGARIDQVAVLVAVALDLDRGAGVEPVRERPAHAEAELVEAEVEGARLRLRRRAAGELRHDLRARHEVGGSDEEPAEPEAGELGLGQSDRLQDVVAQVDLLLGRRRHLRAERARRGRGRHGDCRGDRCRLGRRSDRSRRDDRRGSRRRRRDRRRRSRRGDSRLAGLLEPVQPLVQTTNLIPERLRFLSAEPLGERRARTERSRQGAREDSESDEGSHAHLLCVVRDRCLDHAPRAGVRRTDGARRGRGRVV
jgi:hypothetical protein